MGHSSGGHGGKGGGLQSVGVKPGKAPKNSGANASATPLKRPKKGPHAPKTKPKDIKPGLGKANDAKLAKKKHK